ncbi:MULTISPECIES: hypothetical protein [unclassified Treponema]|uniref:hypothetical protein n=1 Tax=unclassified Treponema TaxID=2638727 RepID=UPI0020A59428|nr:MULTISPECIES: hypothetical protein [unclassified Treponema]UTC66023.1 hypothetical protein E4O06_08300 [Treponema sp. OMZ 789]UTC68753.1 hypothetical protein E4O01_08440 [Treponema sp. OMZ 790]UTC71482.1 hypothetical protein E4O02_08630 [Treponema sp. OMZ 791]
MAINWSEHVNTNFYGADSSYKDNTEKVEFKSGREIEYLKNSRPKKKHSVNLWLKDKGTVKTDGKTEFEHFLYWYEMEAKSGTVPCNLTDIITGTGTKQYRVKVTGWTGQRHKEVSLELTEA